jgi:hypothetical protein
MQTLSGTKITNAISFDYRITVAALPTYAALTLQIDGPRTNIACAVIDEERDRLGWTLEHALDIASHTTRWVDTSTGSVGYVRTPRPLDVPCQRVQDALHRWLENNRDR